MSFKSLGLSLVLLVGSASAAADLAGLADCRQALALPAGAAQRPDCIATLYRSPRSEWPAPTVDAGVVWQELAPRAPLPAVPPKLVKLGQTLFAEPMLSRNRDISCLSCHAPHLGFADGRRFALGFDASRGPRHTPHLLGVGQVPALMWDGRAADLETQALLPLTNPIEMAADLPETLRRLRQDADYPARFAQAFGDAEISQPRLAAALAAFQRGIEAPRSRFDDFIEGRNPQALNEAELRGLHLFRTQARCMNCHSGPQLTRHDFHHIGMSFLGRSGQDAGRQAISGRAEDMGAVRTPSLRGVKLTAPYMHLGNVPLLHGVIDLYNAGMPQTPKREPPLPGPSPLIKPLKLNAQDMRDLEAFLNTL